jgi:hypothetical protein
VCTKGHGGVGGVTGKTTSEQRAEKQGMVKVKAGADW